MAEKINDSAGPVATGRGFFRRWCPSCQATFHLANDPPKRAGLCDACGAGLVQREDDRETVVARERRRAQPASLAAGSIWHGQASARLGYPAHHGHGLGPVLLARIPMTPRNADRPPSPSHDAPNPDDTSPALAALPCPVVGPWRENMLTRSRDHLSNKLSLVRAYRRRDPRVSAYPSVVNIEVSSLCNLSRPMCSRPHEPKRASGTMDFATYRKIVDEVCRYADLAVLHNSGEPLLNRSLPEMISYAHDAGMPTMLSTNATLLREGLAEDLINSSSPEPFLKIGSIHEQRGNRALAERAYELALERQPQNAAACERLALLYVQAGRNDDARVLFERALDVQSDRWRSHDGLGILADRRQDYVAAIGHYDRALEIEPRAASVMNNRGYSRFLSGDPVRAESDLKEAIRLGARNGAWMNLGKVQASQARYAEALQSFLNEMDMPHAYNLLGVVAMERDDDLMAKKYFESASRASPRYFEAAQRNLSIVNERLASTMPVVGARVVTSETEVYSNDTHEVRVGLVRRGDQVQVLESRHDRSRIKSKASGSDDGHVGWVPSGALADRL